MPEHLDRGMRLAPFDPFVRKKGSGNGSAAAGKTPPCPRMALASCAARRLTEERRSTTSCGDRRVSPFGSRDGPTDGVTTRPSQWQTDRDTALNPWEGAGMATKKKPVSKAKAKARKTKATKPKSTPRRGQLTEGSQGARGVLDVDRKESGDEGACRSRGRRGPGHGAFAGGSGRKAESGQEGPSCWRVT